MVVANDTQNKAKERILWFNQLGLDDHPLVGGKNSSLGELINELSGVEGINVPNGFATTTYAYFEFLESTGLKSQLQNLFQDLDPKNVNQLNKIARSARTLILNQDLPIELCQEITDNYQQLCELYGKDTSVAIRSSATAEDLPDASFAGQQDTYLCVQGIDDVILNIKRCMASIFNARAISYRSSKGFDHFSISLSVGVQKMVRSDLATAGVMFSIDTESGFQNAALITAAYGLGENVVQGAVVPDEYLVFKPTLNDGYKPIIGKKLGSKELKMVFNPKTKDVENHEVEPEDTDDWALSNEEMLLLARWACVIEEHYSRQRGVHTPMDIEWAKDGITNEMFIVQARPETVESRKDVNVLVKYILEQQSRQITTGRPVGSKIGSGVAHIILDPEHIGNFQEGEVLVTSKTDPDWEPAMKKASAIITDQGGKTCHSAIICRENGIPAIVGANNATSLIQTGEEVTVSCAEGEDGVVFEGLLPFHVDEQNIDGLPSTQTQVLLNVGDPSHAFSLSRLPVKGVGLARLEFIINNYLKIHPLALVNPDRVTNASDIEAIEQLTKKYQDKTVYFVDRLARGISQIAAAFYPNNVIVRMSDLKSSEYREMIGGKDFEPQEENAMIGWRGASRYYDPDYLPAFKLECEAYRKVRDEKGFKNVIPMIPFCRTPQEAQEVQKIMAECGLVRGQNDLQIYMMIEVPSNVIIMDEFCEYFDGFSIGSNDLTQLTLAVDRNSQLVDHIFDERSSAVKKMISMAIKTAKQYDKKIGICGQAPSDYPEFLEFLVKEGIDSISLNPDCAIKSILEVSRIEQNLQ